MGTGEGDDDAGLPGTGRVGSPEEPVAQVRPHAAGGGKVGHGEQRGAGARDHTESGMRLADVVEQCGPHQVGSARHRRGHAVGRPQGMGLIHWGLCGEQVRRGAAEY